MLKQLSRARLREIICAGIEKYTSAFHADLIKDDEELRHGLGCEPDEILRRQRGVIQQEFGVRISDTDIAAAQKATTVHSLVNILAFILENHGLEIIE